METVIFLIFLFVLVPIILIIQNQGKREENKSINIKEKVGNAVGTYAFGVAQEISGLARSITESDETRDRRKIIQLIHLYINKAMSGNSFYNKEDLMDMYNDEALKPFHVTAKEWQSVITKSFAIGEITKKCVYKGVVQKNFPNINKSNYEGDEFDDGQNLRDALAELGIPKDDWIKWGYSTLSMYEVVREIESFWEKIK